MKAVLEFDLPEDRDEYTLANNGHKYWIALWEIYYGVLRTWYRHDDREAIPMEEINDKLWDVLNVHNIDLDEVS